MAGRSDEVLLWRGHRVGTIAVVAELCGIAPSTYRSLRARPGVNRPPAPDPITYPSDDWGPQRGVLLTHPETGEAMWNLAEVEEWMATRPGLNWRQGQVGHRDRGGPSGVQGRRSA